MLTKRVSGFLPNELIFRRGKAIFRVMNTTAVTIPEIFDYGDYRLFLREAYEARKGSWRHFSHRYIAKQCGFSSGFFAKVAAGKSNISPEIAQSLGTLFGLFGDRLDYFINLVEYDQAKSDDERSASYSRMEGLRAQHRAVVDDEQLNYFDRWYHAVIREAAAIEPGNREPKMLAKAIAKKIWPPLSPQEVEGSLELLLKLELLRRDETGWHRVDRVLLADRPGHTGAVRSFARSSLDQARSALEELPPESRSISTVVLSVSPEGEAEVRDRVNRFRRQLVDFASDTRGADRVVQLNLQFFPHRKES